VIFLLLKKLFCAVTPFIVYKKALYYQKKTTKSDIVCYLTKALLCWRKHLAFGSAGCCEVVEPFLSFTLDNLFNYFLLYIKKCKMHERLPSCSLRTCEKLILD